MHELLLVHKQRIPTVDTVRSCSVSKCRKQMYHSQAIHIAVPAARAEHALPLSMMHEVVCCVHAGPA